jgi:hypothetical protein
MTTRKNQKMIDSWKKKLDKCHTRQNKKYETFKSKKHVYQNKFNELSDECDKLESEYKSLPTGKKRDVKERKFNRTLKKLDKVEQQLDKETSKERKIEIMCDNIEKGYKDLERELTGR